MSATVWIKKCLSIFSCTYYPINDLCVIISKINLTDGVLMLHVLLEDDITVLPLSVRSLNCLRRADIHTIGAMMDYPPDEFINIRNMGKKSVEEIRLFIRELKDGTGEYVLVESNERFSCKSSIGQDDNTSASITVFLDETGAVVQDMPIKDLQLSVRAKNSLIHSGHGFASQLVGISYEDLMNLKNMGKKTAEEVLAYIEKISVQREGCVPQNETSHSGNDLTSEMCTAYGEEESVWLRELSAIKAQFPEAIGENLIYRLYDSVFVRGTLKATILRIIEGNGGAISKVTLEGKLPRHLNNTTILQEILLELETISAIEIGEVMIERQYPSIVDFATHIKDDRIRDIVQGKIKGKTLQEIGEQYDVTRERARQLMQKGLLKKPCLREDKYAYLYDHYDFTLEDFTLAYDEPSETYYYLEMISRTNRSKRKPLEEILTDVAVTPELRKKAERAIYKQYISTDGVWIKKARSTLVKHFVKTYCNKLTEYDLFFQKYHEWLDVLGLGSDVTLAIEYRTYENKLNQCDYVLWNQWNSFRYYNIPELDFEELLSTLDLEQFDGIELSTLKLFRDYPNLMQQYDIHDEYELHNLLKKIWPTERKRINFKRMPTIEIGTANRDDQVLSLLLQYAPISGDAFAEHYEDAYGVKAATVLANYMSAFDDYYYDGIYSIDSAALPVIQFNHMKAILNLEFYTIQDVKRLYKREFPHSDESLINPYTLKTLDFRVYSGYVVRNTYASAADYFRSLLTVDDVVDARNIRKSIQCLVAYSSELYKLRAIYEIVEFSPLQYINIRRLNEVGVTKEQLKSYCNSVANQYEKGEYFTVVSLWKDGFVHEMDELGFGEWFYASVLLEDRARFSYQRIGGTRIFLCGKTGANLGDMLVWILEVRREIDFYDLMDLLKDHYGITLSKEKLLTVISGTELYYDRIMEAVYIDYDTYFEEI